VPDASDFLALRERVLAAGPDLARARRAFDWRPPAHFNWVGDYFARIAEGYERPALRVVDDAGGDASLSFAALLARSAQVANLLARAGVGQGDRVLLMLGNRVELWETMLATIRLGAVVIPATTLLTSADLEDRLTRGAVRAVVADAALAARFEGLAGAPVRIAVGPAVPGWIAFDDSRAEPVAHAVARTRADDLLLLYFTSGTTARPKLVAHTQTSYPVGHLSTVYWLGLRPGDLHLNLSSPGWAKHAWSCFFAPWIAGAAIFIANQPRFNARDMLDAIRDNKVTTLCAPPTVWRMFVQEDLKSWKTNLREVCGAGEPLNPEVIDQVRTAWGLTVRDGFGQTETTLLVGNPPGAPLKPGSMGRTMPGYRILLLDPDDRETEEGEICVALDPRPTGLMQGYQNDDGTNRPLTGAVYRTGDVGARDADGYITYVGRADDVFKASDYRISPFELESVLIEHAAVAEAAVVPAPDPLRLAVPKAYVILAAGVAPDRDTALAIFRHVRERLAPFKRIRRIEFSDLPKTISGKIRRVELRRTERQLASEHRRADAEFREEDFPELAR